ncbi:MAG: phytanoyl-CoA dioxygenase family protein [Gammaproteobacteria bacterium]|nr:phytanoyl-CoA dioxygenase family protein [Gammaproteobacteria bacterium]
MQTDAHRTTNAIEHRDSMRAYLDDGKKRALRLPNRGSITYDETGSISQAILDAYWQYGFFVFTGVLRADEVEELRADVERVLDGAPSSRGDPLDHRGQPAVGHQFKRPSFSFSKPLSDPLGGTERNHGRHPVKMAEPIPDENAPEEFIDLLIGNLQIMDSCLRLYGHPDLLSVAAAVNGDDFVPFNEVTFLKEPGLGVSVAWHQDGTTHWDSPDWNQGKHGFNFMAQIYGSTPSNGVWVVPGTHKQGKVDIKALVEESGSERISTAVPMVCDAGDVVISNRQLVHGSFANTSTERRVTLNMGFLPRESVLNVTNVNFAGREQTYDEERVHQRSRMIAIGIDARHQRFPDERRYVYQPLVGEEDLNRWNEDTRETVVKDYNLLDVHL